MSASQRLPEVPLEVGTLVLGDLHLDVSAQASPHAAFEAWSRSLEDVPRVVILGDLFDAWVGPAHTRVPVARTVCERLHELVARGTAVDVVHGNRDFLLDGAFEQVSGARVHPHGLVGILPGDGRTRVLLVHGDELCTLDRPYQRMKRLLRSGPVRLGARLLPRAVALWAAGRLRATSVRAVAAKPPAAKQQQEEAARALARQHDCDQLVCGHSHVFRDQALEGGPRWRVVDAFGRGRDLLRVAPPGELEALGSAREGPV